VVSAWGRWKVAEVIIPSSRQLIILEGELPPGRLVWQDKRSAARNCEL